MRNFDQNYPDYLPPDPRLGTSLHSPEVRARLARLMQQRREEVPVDFVLNDQIGSRSWLRDFNPGGSGDMQSYEDDWLEFTRRYAGQRSAHVERGVRLQCGISLAGTADL